MTPKEKAWELHKDMYHNIPVDELGKDQEAAKQCALIAVDEIIIILSIWDSFNISKNTELIYWQEVKQEIENL